MSFAPRLLAALLLASACQPAIQVAAHGAPVARLAFAARRPVVDASSPEAFTRSVRARYAVTFRKVDFAIAGPLELTGHTADNPDARIVLEDPYHDCLATPARCEDIVDRYAAVAGVAVYRAQDTVKRSEIFAAVRPASYVEKLLVENPRAHVEPLVGELRVIIENGLDQTVPTGVELAEIDLTAAAASTVARRNVSRRIGSPLALFAAMPVPGTAVAERGQFYDSSLLLAFTDWQSLAAGWDLPIYAGVPAADQLALCVGNDETAIAGLRQATAETFRQSAYPVSPELYRFTGSGWEVVVPTSVAAR